MKKRYIFAFIVIIITCFFLAQVILSSKENKTSENTFNIPRFGQKQWTYNIKEKQWTKYNSSEGEENSQDKIILKIEVPDDNSSITKYSLLTGLEDINNKKIELSESSIEFLTGKKLFTYYPREFSYYELVYNGVSFVPRQLTNDDIKHLFKNYKIIKISDLKKGKLKLKFNKINNRYLILNDIGDNFYKYYIIPNDSKNLKIEDFSNQIEIKAPTIIKLQKLEGCTKKYPCYEIEVTK